MSDFQQFQASFATHQAFKEQGLLKDMTLVADSNINTKELLDYLLSFNLPPQLTILADSIRQAYPI